MKLSNVVISNIATFPYIHDLHHAPGVDFTVENDGTIHIFIGPNGAGKSMYLDVIQQICSTVFFQPYVCNVQDIATIHALKDKKIIHHKPHYIHNMHENKTGVGKPSHVFITFALNKQDRENIKFIYDNQDAFNDLIKTYASVPVVFNYTGIDSYLDGFEYITCKTQVDTHTNTAWRLDSNASDIEKFIFDVFTHFHLLQHCIAIHNILYPLDQDHWRALHATFATIGSYRNLLHYSDVYTIGHEESDRFLITMQDTSISSVKTAQDHLTGLMYVKKKIALYLYKHMPHATAQDDTSTVLQGSDIYNDVNAFCKKYFRRSLIVKRVPQEGYTYQFLLKDDEGNTYYLDDLSAGEKSMLGIICTVYGYGLDQGLLVIDEPELHLHPQLQKQFLRLIEEIARKYGLQCIMTTHSSLMINDKNIKHVYRFHTDNGITHIVKPSDHYTEDASKLMQILKFTNTAKIFFVKKIIMVEGETDELAFGNYLSYLANHDPKRYSIIKDYEIVNINGKGGYPRWKKFLNSFGIQSYFIGDWDNIQDTGNQPIDMHYYENRMRRSRGVGGYMSKSEKYKNIIRFLKSHEPKHWDEIEERIRSLYAKGIYILQQGDIEAYLGMQEKGLEETVQFFQNDFSSWIKDYRYEDERIELNKIFAHIFGS